LPTRLKRLALVAAALATVAAALPAAAAAGPDDRTRRPSDGGLSAVIRTTEYGVPHIVAQDYASPGFDTGRAQAADEVCTPADGFVTVNGERSRWLGADAPADSSMSSATENLAGDHGERIPVSGGADALGVWNHTNARWDPAGGGHAEVVAGSSHIPAVGWDGSGCPVARTPLTYSQSDDPGSAHFSDQTRLFSAGRWVTSRYCEKDVLSSPALKVVTVRE
jgi:acyl-homoserine-lactone acylase